MSNLEPTECAARHILTSVDERDGTVNEFLSESGEKLDQLDRELNELWQNPATDDLLPSIFRTIHTIKGASGFLEFSRLECLAHAGESVLTGIREGRLGCDPAVIEVLLDLVVRIRNILDAITTIGTEGVGTDRDILTKIHRLLESGETESFTVVKGSPVTSEGNQTRPIGQLLVERAGVSWTAVQAARELQRQGDLRTLGEILVAQGAVTPAAAREIIEYQQEARAASVNETSVRVEVELLDRIIRLAGDLVHSGNQAVESAGRCHDRVMVRISRQILVAATQLHCEAMKTRVQPIATLEPLLLRLVHDVSRVSGKSARLNLKGSEIQVDRVVLSAIKDPLMHLVRNSIDHGIECSQERLAAGKTLEGSVTLLATHGEGQIFIEVSDDGAGIDLDRVKQKAVSLGAITIGQLRCMSEKAIANLVFLPGLSTARTVSHISGRGVGMDVVKTKVEKIGGSVELRSAKGKGTTVRMAIPLAQFGVVRSEGAAR